MKAIQKYLLEYAPTNPNDIILRNKFYPKGLTEEVLYNYYLSVKDKLIGWIDKRPVSFFLLIDGSIVIKRKNQGKPIFLTTSNFNDLITGRTISIFKTQLKNTNYFVVDIDPGAGMNIKDAHRACDIAIKYLKPLQVKKYEKLISGPKGIHLVGYMNKKVNIDSLRDQVKTQLEQQNEILVNVKGRKRGVVNFDLSPNYAGNIHICRYSLTKEGLICDDLMSRGTKAGKPL